MLQGSNEAPKALAGESGPGAVLLRRKDVQAYTGLPRSTLYAQIRAGNFPKPIRLTARAGGWAKTDLDAWIAGRIAAAC